MSFDWNSSFARRTKRRKNIIRHLTFCAILSFSPRRSAAACFEGSSRRPSFSHRAVAPISINASFINILWGVKLSVTLVQSRRWKAAANSRNRFSLSLFLVLGRYFISPTGHLVARGTLQILIHHTGKNNIAWKMQKCARLRFTFCCASLVNDRGLNDAYGEPWRLLLYHRSMWCFAKDIQLVHKRCARSIGRERGRKIAQLSNA